MHFSSDAIDVKQSVESTFKVWGRSLTTALNEVHFIVNLYSFPQHLVSQANPYPSQPFANPPPPPQAEQLPNSQVRTSKMVDSLDYHPCPSRLASRIHPFIFLKTPQGFTSLSRTLVEFSLKLLYSTMCGKYFQIYGVHIRRKCIDSRHFYSCPSQLKTHLQVFVITHQAEENYLFLQAVFFRKSVSPDSRKWWRKL